MRTDRQSDKPALGSHLRPIPSRRAEKLPTVSNHRCLDGVRARVTVHVHQPELLAGQILRLEPLLADHADELAPLLDDHLLLPVYGGRATLTGSHEVRYRQWETRRSPDGGEHWFNWVIRRQDDDRAVGVAQATVREGRALVAWVIATKWQRRG
jgi:hypothetical protein